MEKKLYVAPQIQEEKVELEDVIAASSGDTTSSEAGKVSKKVSEIFTWG